MTTENQSGPLALAAFPEVPGPIIFTAGGAASTYYTYPFFIAIPGWERLFVVSLLFFCLVLSFLRVLSYAPFLFQSFAKPEVSERVPRFILMLHLLLSFGIAGAGLGLTARSLLPGPSKIPLNLDQVTGLRGVLSDDPRAFNDGRGIGSLELVQAAGEGDIRVSAQGKAAVFFPAEAIPRLKEFGRGSELYVEGAMATGNQASDNQGLLFRARAVHVLRPAPVLEQFRTGFRSAVMEKFGIEAGSTPGGSVPGGSSSGRKAPSWAALASALLLGVRDDLDSDLKEAFTSAGCTHVLALSGMHLAILSASLVFLLRLFIGVRPAALIGAFFIIVYIFLAGAQPSLVRAGIMYLLGTLALWGFLKKNFLSLLAMAFILQIFIQRESGISLSFILSYLALLGILCTGETIHELLLGRIPEVLNKGLSASLGAVIATAAVTSYYFGVLRPIGIIASLLIMPLASLFMILALSALALVSLLPFLFGLFDFILSLLYRLMETVVFLAGKVPGIKARDFLLVLVISLLLAAALEFLKYHDRKYRRSIISFDA